jgi:hypothetical protein
MANFLARLLKDAKELATVMRCTDKKCLEITASSVQGCIKWPDECFPLWQTYSALETKAHGCRSSSL